MKKLFKRIKNNKLLRYTGVGIIFLLLLLVGRVTYAYFAADINAAQGNVVAGNDTVDAIKFEVGDPLSLNVNSNTLPENGTNLVTNTTTKARLLANSTTNEATYTYYVYLNLTDNTFVYTKENTPEIILSVVDPNGNEVTDISGLTYGTFNGVAGFDVTTYEGMILLSQFNITSTSSTEETIQEWSITLTYLNQPYDQTENYGHSVTTEVRMQKNKYTLANHIIDLAGTIQGTNNIYHHNGTILATESDNDINIGDVIDANDDSYRYSGATPNNWICFGMNETECDDEHLYRIVGVFNEKIIGENGNSTGKTEQRVKLIKADLISERNTGVIPYNTKEPSPMYTGKLAFIPFYYWSGSKGNDSNIWENSTFNSDILNGSFLTLLGSSWSDKIAYTEWKVGGNNFSNLQIGIPFRVYQNEIINMNTGKFGNNIETHNAKVGLMYASDYAYAASLNLWNKNDYSWDEFSNWLSIGENEWTITRSSDYSSRTMIIYSGRGKNNGSISYSEVNVETELYGVNTAARPTFYLNSDVTLTGGSGTETDPYRIA